MADGAPSELLEPGPSGTVAAKAHEFFEIYGIDPGFPGGKPPHGLEPMGNR